MGLKILILGESGTGKSASMRNFANDEILLVNVAKKSLPFKGKFETINTDNYNEIKKAIKNTSKKIIVIDDAQYLMANEYMRRATEKGFDKFTEIAQNYWELMQVIDNLPDDKIVFVLSHIERDQNGNEKVKTIGKLLDEKITVEGLYAIVLKTVVQDGKYFFQTQNSGRDTCKSPIGLFSSYLIDNDLKSIVDTLRDYYELGDYVAPVEIVKEPVKVVEEKSLAETIADEKVPPTPKPRTRTRTVETTLNEAPVVETAVVETPAVETAVPERKTRSYEDKVNDFVNKAETSQEQPKTITRTRVRGSRAAQ